MDRLQISLLILIKPIKCLCCPHIDFALILICKANQLTGLYLTATIAFNGLSEF